MLVERPRPRVVREHPHAGWFAVGAVCFGAFMGQLDASIVTLTFPALQREFAQPLAAVQWVSLSYLLTLVGLLAAVGRVADAVGRKLTYVHGFAVFTAASIACGLAPTLGLLVVFRILQAVGAAMLQANSVALVVTSVPKAKMRSALGVQAAAQALGLALGPAVGSVLVGTVGWRWVFLVNVPVGIIGLVAGRYLLPRTRERSPLGRRFDGAGVALLATASTAVLLALSGLSGLGVPGWSIPVLALLGVLAAVGFVGRERRASSPIVRLSVLRPPAVSLGLVGALCGYLVLFGPLTLLPQVLGSQGAAGLVLTSLPAGFAVAAVAAERVLPGRFGTRARSVTGAAAGGIGCLALLAVGDSVPWTGVSLFVVGLGLGMFIPANNSAIMGAIPATMSATGGGLVNMARGLGTALGVALVTLCLHAGGEAGVPLALSVLALAGVVAAVTGLSAGQGRQVGSDG
ncbi:MFS transporter [Amycolatopsis mongoliensis]|uniref:MFS transporter n=1 Tax=Amycolatopsis mongoliensis TaxID=715475 RepID=A0A9Y2K1D6_9PSEU|nr:MFS transporter [Amycolatopsis sp. 4-36]WIY07491.1 MFS transporter [Amycolatopsis sp. 4-36]